MQSEQDGKEGYLAMVTAMTGAGLDLLTEPIEDEFGMTVDDIQPVIATERTPFVLVSRADAPWSSYEELVEAAKADPGKLRYIASVGSQLDIAMTRLMAEGGWEAEKIPAGGSDEAATIVAAGEGDFTMLTPSVARTHTDAGKATVHLVISPEPEAPEGYPDATTTAAIGLADEPWGSLRGLVVAPEVPELHRTWLFELFKAGADEPAYKERVANLPGASQVILDGEQVRDEIDNALTFAEPIIRDLGLHHEQN
jgi:tripartite-type tricarboxylate transporter receptor subunit TctC